MDKDIALQPLWDYIILEFPEDKKSLIIKPENSDPVKIGTLELVVLYTGPDCRNIKPGDRLVCNPQAVISFACDKKQYYMVSERGAGALVGPLRKLEQAKDGRLPGV